MERVIHRKERPLSDVWTSLSGTDRSGPPALNERPIVERCRRHAAKLALLKLHGVPVAGRSETEPLENVSVGSRRYCIHLFGHQVLRMFCAEESDVWLHTPLASREREEWQDVSETLPAEERIRVTRLAVRALYALGLDYGAVWIGGRHSRLRVQDVSANPLVSAELVGVYEEARTRYQMQWREEQGRLPRVVLGADPEFALRDAAGRMGVASRYLDVRGVAGCDTARLRRGADATERPLAELRPEPSSDPRTLTRRIRQAMTLASGRIDPSLEWVAGGMAFDGYPTGGHIHVSGVALNFHLLRALDTYVSLPLFLLEDEGSRRRRPRYGFWGDYREQAHGGFEYRTLPSWLVSPMFTEGVLALTKVVATSHWHLSTAAWHSVQLQRAFYRGDKKPVRPVVQQLWRTLRTLPLYRQYMRGLDPFLTASLTGESWPAHADIRPLWLHSQHPA